MFPSNTKEKLQFCFRISIFTLFADDTILTINNIKMVLLFVFPTRNAKWKRWNDFVCVMNKMQLIVSAVGSVRLRLKMHLKSAIFFWLLFGGKILKCKIIFSLFLVFCLTLLNDPKDRWLRGNRARDVFAFAF